MMKEYADLTDEQLLELRAAGDTEVAEYLLDKYKTMVRKKVRMLYLAGGDQDDLIQEGMIGLFKAIRDYKPDHEASFYTFANLCVDRQLYRAIQSSNRQKHQPLNSYISMNASEWEEEQYQMLQPSPENILIDQEEASHTEREIYAHLSKFENTVLQHYLEGENYIQIAESLGKSPKSIDNALQRIRGKVRKGLKGKEKNK